MTRRVPLAAFATLLGVIVMAGCTGSNGTPTSVALSEAQGFPPDAPVNEPWNDPDWSGEPLAWISADGAAITIVTFQSSTCPYIGVRIEALAATLLGVEFEQAAAEACTDDLAPRTHVFAVPEGVDVSGAPLTAEIMLSASAFEQVEPQVVRVPVAPAGSLLDDGAADTPPVDSIALEVVRGTPADIVLDELDLERGEPLAFWGEGRSTIRVVTWGSSGCPPIARSLQPTEPGIVVLDFAPNPAEFCTADFAPTTHVLETPEGVDTDDVALTVTIEERGGTSAEFRVPIR